MTTAVILPPSETSFLPVAGLPLVQRTALSALCGGCDSVIVLGGAQAGRLREIFDRDRRTSGVHVLEGESVTGADAERLVLLPSDWLVTPAAVRRVCETTVSGKPVLFQPLGAGNDGQGVVLCPGDQLARCTTVLGLPVSADHDDDGAPTLLRVFFNGEPCQRVVGRDAAGAAEERLIEHLRAATADTDGPIARFDRALSTRISRVLTRTPLRPNHITTIGTLVGLLGAWCFLQGTYGSNILGALLFWAAVIIDGCDGEVARLKFQETRYGALYDVVTDNIVHAAVFAGLGLGYVRSIPGADLPLFVGLLLGGFFCALAATYFCLLRHPPVKHLQPKSRKGRIRQRLLRGFESVMNRDFAYLLIPLAVIDRLGWFLWGCVFGTYAYAAGLVWIYRWREEA